MKIINFIKFASLKTKTTTLRKINYSYKEILDQTIKELRDINFMYSNKEPDNFLIEHSSFDDV